MKNVVDPNGPKDLRWHMTGDLKTDGSMCAWTRNLDSHQLPCTLGAPWWEVLPFVDLGRFG
jgi:hypothetical protein